MSEILLDPEDEVYRHRLYLEYPKHNVVLLRYKSVEIIFTHFLLEVSAFGLVKHKNGNLLDCRKVNLEKLSAAIAQRTKESSQGTKSGYRGVYAITHSTKFKAVATVNGKQVSIGTYATADLAAVAYNKYMLAKFGKLAWLNTIGEKHGQKNTEFKLLGPTESP